VRGRGSIGATVVALTLAATAPAAADSSLDGTVTAAGGPIAKASVTLYAGSRQATTELGHATTDSTGRFSITYTEPAGGVLYVDANRGALRLRTVMEVGGTTATVNELTTVAASYALAQFSGPEGVSGPSPGLENAAATSFNLADPSTGKAGAVVTNDDNGGRNDTLATLNTIANLVSLCADESSASCSTLLRLTTPPGGAAPDDTVQAAVELARNPTLAPARLYALARKASVYQPALDSPPSAWVLVLLYTATDLYASGRIAIDRAGNVWSSTNWLPGTQNPSTSVSVLDPVGRPTLGSPINGNGMKGGAWGIAIDPGGSVWAGSFGGDAISQYSATGAPLSPDTGWTDGDLDHPQGMAVDQKGNIWIANNYGPESQPGEGNVVVYPGGDPSKALTISGGGLNHPFAVQIDGYGRAWVTNAGLGGARLVGTRAAPLVGKFGGSVTVIGPDFEPTSFSPIEDSSFKWPLGLSIDSHGNAWVANYFGSTVTAMSPDGTVAGVYRLPRGTLPWSEAVDGSDRIWVAGFAIPRVWLLCGAEAAACPPGSAQGAVLSPKQGFASKAFQHFTSIQIDQSGNVWLSNNWSKLVPPVGGTGIAEMIGVATPVCAPLEPLPAKPSSSSTTACPRQTAASLPGAVPAGAPAANTTTSSDSTLGLWVVAAVAVLMTATASLLLRRRRARLP
jgi:hypothetical protein